MLRRILAVCANQVLIYGLQGISSILTARLLGPEQRGVLSVAATTAGFISGFACIGLPGALVFNLSRTNDPRAALGRAVAVCLRAVPGMMLLVLFLYATTYRVGHGSVLRGLSPSVLWGSLTLSVGLLASVLLLSFMTGLQDFRWRNIVEIIPPFLVATAVIWYWRSATHLTAAALVWINVGCLMVAMLIGAGYIAGCYRPDMGVGLPRDWQDSYVRYGLKSYLANLAQSLNYRLDTLILNALSGSTAVGIYSCGVAAAELLLFFPASAAVVLYPMVASVQERDGVRATAFALGSSMYLVLVSGVVLFGALPWLIPHLYGSAFAPAVLAARWLLPGMLGLTVVKMLSSAVAGLGHPEYMTYATGVGLAQTVVLDLFMIPRWGFVGAAWASTAAYCTSAVILLVLYIRLSKTSVRGFLRGLVVEPAGQVGAALAVSWSSVPWRNSLGAAERGPETEWHR